MTRSEAIRKAIDIIVYLEAHFAKSQNAKKDAEEIIEALEQINEEQNQWIPITEKLPKDDDKVLVTIKACGESYVAPSVFRNGKFFQMYLEFYAYENPVAWMPFPTPMRSTKCQ